MNMGLLREWVIAEINAIAQQEEDDYGYRSSSPRDQAVADMAFSLLCASEHHTNESTPPYPDKGITKYGQVIVSESNVSIADFGFDGIDGEDAFIKVVRWAISRLERLLNHNPSQQRRI